MVETVENLILEHLRHLRASADRLDERLTDMTHRVGRLETTVAQIHVVLAEHSTRFDRVDARLSRIEKRLELAEA